MGKLVRLHADQADQAKTVVVAEQVYNLFDLHACVGLVDGTDGDFYVLAKNTTLRGVVRERIKIGKRVRWDRRSPPLDDIAVVVVMRRFDQDKLKTPLGPRRCEHGHTPQRQNFFIFSHNSEDGNRASATAPPVVGAGATHVSVWPEASVAAGNSGVGSAPKCRNYLRFSGSGRGAARLAIPPGSVRKRRRRRHRPVRRPEALPDRPGPA